MDVFKLFEVVTPQEAEKGQVPGLERAIAKSKGPEFATLLHQFAAEFKVDPKSATALALFKECAELIQSRRRHRRLLHHPSQPRRLPSRRRVLLLPVVKVPPRVLRRARKGRSIEKQGSGSFHGRQ